MSILQTIRKYEQKFDLRAKRFLWKHPILGFLSIFVGMPIFVLFCVCVSTTIITLPIAWLFGLL